MKIKFLSTALWGSFFIATFFNIDVPQNTVNGINYKATAATKQAEFEQQEVTAIEKLVDFHIEAANKEDIEAYMSTIHEDSTNREQNRNLMESIFDAYDLNYAVDEYEIVSITEDQAQVKIVQTTTKINGPEFRDNRLTAIHYLQKSNDDRWKFLALKITDIEYLD